MKQEFRPIDYVPPFGLSLLTAAVAYWIIMFKLQGILPEREQRLTWAYRVCPLVAATIFFLAMPFSR
ncbi:hypothetical protein MMMDOFMJ_4328 [Methylobacterium gnaphalii]|uniref:Uncharacterized protein n=1 Tax=Methylobacterium gnaphalii TaxID=1010610 RepID=A0A512JRT4_9HYPH|nr:hypothetical protein MGN01_45100 [Methylobacterium gnaphalii]GJD71372.1 hypothetical protein MMMDOFMJ_4328 [Methylobacterium gnaphalii]GLS51387.1 hypothetical protein GCM10007885_42440 [Methylobacterium gnaphalii]